MLLRLVQPAAFRSPAAHAAAYGSHPVPPHCPRLSLSTVGLARRRLPSSVTISATGLRHQVLTFTPMTMTTTPTNRPLRMQTHATTHLVPRAQTPLLITPLRSRLSMKARKNSTTEAIAHALHVTELARSRFSAAGSSPDSLTTRPGKRKRKTNTCPLRPHP